MLKSVSRSNFSRLLALPSRSLHEANRKLDVKEAQEIKIPVPWGHIAGKWWGDTNIQPLIGLHGHEDNAGTWEPLASLLDVPSFLAIDFPGHGLSSHIPIGRPYLFLDSVILLRRIAKYFKWDKLSLLGHSFGSCCSFVYAATFPDSVNVYISIDCARTLMSMDVQTDIAQLRTVGDKLLYIEQNMLTKGPPSYSYDQIVDVLHSGMLESPTKDSCKVLLKRGMLPSQKPDTFYFSRDPRLRFHAIDRFPFDYLLKCAPRIKCHHLSIRGLQGFLRDGDEREEIYLKTRDLIKKTHFQFEHHDVEGTHHLHLNNPERVAPLINNFLKLCQGKWWGRSDAKPLLGLHGWQDNASTWDRLASLLPSDISLLAFDSPGHGLSSHFPRGIPYRITDQIFVLRQIVNHFGWDKVSLLAHSMGAVQSFMYSAVYPDQIDNMIFIDAFKPLSVDPEKDIDKLADGIDKYLIAENLDDSIKPSYSYEEVVRRLYDGIVGKSLTKESCEVLLKRGSEKQGDGYVFTRDSRLKVGRLGGWTHDRIVYMATCITCNVLFIKADPGLVFETLKHNKETLEALKKSANIFEYHVVEGMHHVHLNNPERVAPIIVNFLKSPNKCPSDIPSASLEKMSKKEHLNFM